MPKPWRRRALACLSVNCMRVIAMGKLTHGTSMRVLRVEYDVLYINSEGDSSLLAASRCGSLLSLRPCLIKCYHKGGLRLEVLKFEHALASSEAAQSTLHRLLEFVVLRLPTPATLLHRNVLESTGSG